jgi:hypothetical protein
MKLVCKPYIDEKQIRCILVFFGVDVSKPVSRGPPKSTTYILAQGAEVLTYLL